MSTIPIDSWAVDLADVTHIYPFVGAEGLMALIGIVLWLAWHVWQVRHENEILKDSVEKYGDEATLQGAIDDHH